MQKIESIEEAMQYLKENRMNYPIFVDIFFGDNATIRTQKEYITRTIRMANRMIGTAHRIEVVDFEREEKERKDSRRIQIVEVK